MKKNFFIAFEGIDGSGKSTQIRMLVDRLKDEGVKLYNTFEPTDSPIGSLIRDIFTHKMEADHRTIAGLFVADRLDHLLNKNNGILKKMDDGYSVIVDRYYFSSYAYHSVHMDLDWVIQSNSLSADLLRPDLHIYIDILPEVSIARLNKGRSTIELYETTENLEQVRTKYLEVIERLKHKENVVIVDGNRPPEIVAKEIWQLVCPLVPSSAETVV